jgi:hypothetical protein
MLNISRLMWTAIFTSKSHRCAVTDVLTGVMPGVGVDVLRDMEIVVMTTPAITLEFVVGVTCAVDVLVVLLVATIIDVVSAIDIDILADESVDGLAAVMTPVEFTLLSP